MILYPSACRGKYALRRTAMMREIAAEPVTSAEYVRSSGG